MRGVAACATTPLPCLGGRNVSVKERVVAVTGAGSGLGRALCKVFAAEGFRVVGLGRSSSSLEETAAAVGSPNFSWLIADVSDARGTRAVFDRILSTHGRVDILFNNAAVYPRESLLDSDMDEWTGAVRTNLCGP